jgi:hypothetical protein
MLAELEARQVNVRNTLLRIGGAVQVLDEQLTPIRRNRLTAKTPPGPANGARNCGQYRTPKSTP